MILCKNYNQLNYSFISFKILLLESHIQIKEIFLPLWETVQVVSYSMSYLFLTVPKRWPWSSVVYPRFTQFNGRMNTLLYKNISLTLYFRKGWFFCGVWEMGGETYTKREDFFFPRLLPGAGGCQHLHPLASSSETPLISCVSHARLCFSTLYLNLTTWFSSRDLLPVTHLLYPSALIMLLFTNHNMTACQITQGHQERIENPRYMLYNRSYFIFGKENWLKDSGPMNITVLLCLAKILLSICFGSNSFVNMFWPEFCCPSVLVQVLWSICFGQNSVVLLFLPKFYCPSVFAKILLSICFCQNSIVHLF